MLLWVSYENVLAKESPTRYWYLNKSSAAFKECLVVIYFAFIWRGQGSGQMRKQDES